MTVRCINFCNNVHYTDFIFYYQCDDESMSLMVRLIAEEQQLLLSRKMLGDKGISRMALI